MPAASPAISRYWAVLAQEPAAPTGAASWTEAMAAVSPVWEIGSARSANNASGAVGDWLRAAMTDGCATPP
ncbi:hypothetical protein ACFXA3_01415 [Streptomyces sp. NPDC059456]|uniref:hypothetical protein n=1 Tax=Streptomyces sp. NPDC059456 TaxID=3346838 RepID=UPI0036B23583